MSLITNPFFRFSAQHLCYFCYQPLAFSHHFICSICQKHILIFDECCPTCGLTLSKKSKTCTYCSEVPPLWLHLVKVGYYHPPLSTLINKLKFQRNEQIAPMLARLLLLSWLKAYRTQGLLRPDILIQVPLHKTRHWLRGFNQTALIAKPLAYWLRCQWSDSTIFKQYATPAQRSLSLTQRRINLKGVFVCKKSIENQHVALLDDVVTSGSTIEEICYLLLSAGAASVQVLCICRTD